MSKSTRLTNLGSSIEGMMSQIGISTSMSKERVNQEAPTGNGTNNNQNDGQLSAQNAAIVSETAFVSAIYNTIAIAVFFSCLALCALAYVVLQAFIRPILWALLTSAFLFAMKRYLTDMARSRLTHIDKSGSTLAIELFLSPFRLIDSAVDCVWSFMLSHMRNLLIGGVVLVLFHLANSLFYENLFSYLSIVVGVFAKLSAWIIYYADTSWQYTCALLLAYTIAIAFYWKEEYCTLFQILSLPVWLSLLFLVSRLMGSTLRPIFVMAFLILSVLGIYSYVFDTIAKHRRKLFDHHAEGLASTSEAPAAEEADEYDDEKELSTRKVFDNETSSPTFYTSQLLNNAEDENASLLHGADVEVETVAASTTKDLNEALIDKSLNEPQTVRRKEHQSISTLKRTRPKNLSFNLTGNETPIRKSSVPETTTTLLDSNESLPIESNSTKIEPAAYEQEASSRHDEETTLDDHDASISSTASSTFFRSTVNFLYQTSLYYFKESPAKPTQTGSSAKANESTANKSAGGQSVPGLRTLFRRRERKSSDKYFKALFWLFIIVKLRYDMYIILPILVLLWKLMKSTYETIFTKSEFMRKNLQLASVWFNQRRAVLAPRPFYILFKLFRKGDHKMNQMLQKSMDSLISAFMIIALILFVLVTVIVLAMQVHSESVQLISITSNILNENIYTKPELRDWLPEKDKLNELYQSSMNSFYLYGREWLSSRLRSSSGVSNNQPENQDFLVLEKKILAQWDSLYAYLSQKSKADSFNNSLNAGGNLSSFNQTLKPFAVPPKSALPETSQPTPVADGQANKTSLWPSIKMLTKHLNTDAFDYNHVAVIIKDNLGIFVSILDSVYSIVRGNITLLSTIILTFLSIIFNSGFALMNFFFSTIVYFTALFYLLAVSDSQFKPLQWITEISFFKSGGPGNSNSSSQSGSTTNLSSESLNRRILLSNAIEESIRSVFFASLKMSSFYGIFTWLMHSSFGVSIVYLPSITAALFGFLPLFGTYWAAFPGVLELWLIQGKPLHSIAFIIIHILPTYVVDAAIYSQIKAGHPYLTGLAFAGGVYCLGLEGAIIGPIVLCLLIVIVKVLTSASISSNVLNTTMSRTYSGFGYKFSVAKSPSVERK